jgi:transposase-like protein
MAQHRPYHPDYGYPDDFRVTVLLYAAVTSVVAAAIHFNIHESTIYRWRRHYNVW